MGFLNNFLKRTRQPIRCHQRFFSVAFYLQIDSVDVFSNSTWDLRWLHPKKRNSWNWNPNIFLLISMVLEFITYCWWKEPQKLTKAGDLKHLPGLRDKWDPILGWIKQCKCTVLGTNISPTNGTCEDDFLFPWVGYVFFSGVRYGNFEGFALTIDLFGLIKWLL